MHGRLTRATTRPIGRQTVPHLRQGGTYEFVLPFRSRECGAHHVHAGPGTRFEHHALVETIQVNCS